MEILLINIMFIKDEPLHPSHFPMGLAYIARILKDSGQRIEILDLNAHRLTNDEVTEKIKEIDFDIVGISGLVTNYKYIKWLISQIRIIKPGKKIIIGGGIATSIPELLFEKTDLDIVVIGEGERTIKELIRVLEKGNGLKGVKGIWYREDGGVIQNSPQELIKDIDEIPFPERELFPYRLYLESEKTINIVSSRGCPYSCHYCYHLFGGYRLRSAQNVIEEIKLARDRDGIERVIFVDDNFMVNKRRLIEICESLKQMGIKWECQGRVDQIDQETLRTMKAAGCESLLFGVESGSPLILKRMNKKIYPEDIERAIRLTREVGISNITTTCMLGYPGETKDTVNETREFCHRLRLAPHFFFTTPFPKTRLYEETIERGLIKDEDAYLESLESLDDFKINLTDLPDAELKDLKMKVEGGLEIYKLFDRVNNSLTKIILEGDKRVVFYGAGSAIRSAINLALEKELKVVGIADGDQKKQGKWIDGFQIIAPDEIEGIEPDVLLITSLTYCNQIYESIRYLETKGIKIKTLN